MKNIKKLTALFIFSLFALFVAFAETEKTLPVNAVQKYTLSNGIEVYLRDNQINEIDALQIFVMGGTA